MKTVFDHLRSRLHAQAGLDLFDPVTRLTPLDLERQWSPEFEQLMRNRMKMGGLRYGLMRDKLRRTTQKRFDFVGNAITRLRQYQASGNDELLVDGANLLLLQFASGHHPTKHFTSSDDGEHTPTTKQ